MGSEMCIRDRHYNGYNAAVIAPLRLDKGYNSYSDVVLDTVVL